MFFSAEQDTPTPDTVKSVGGGGPGVVGRSWLWLLDIERGIGLVIGRSLQWMLAGGAPLPFSSPADTTYIPTSSLPREPLLREPLLREPLLREPLPREPLPREPLPREPLPREPFLREPLPREPLPSLQERANSFSSIADTILSIPLRQRGPGGLGTSARCLLHATRSSPASSETSNSLRVFGHSSPSHIGTTTTEETEVKEVYPEVHLEWDLLGAGMRCNSIDFGEWTEIVT